MNLFDHGERYGRLRVLGHVETKKHGIKWRVGCECGYSGMLVTANQLLKGRKTSCGKCRAIATNAKGKA